jgi:hypothetical protein
MRCALLVAPVVFVLVAPGNDDNLDVIQLNGVPCGLAGTATSPAGQDLDRHKNRYAIPTADDIDPDVSLPAMLAPGKDVNRFDQEKAATIQGFVIKVKPGGHGETCNCGATNEDEIDTHIQLGLANNVPEIQQVIVEVTPRLRKLNGDGWKTPKLRDAFEGKWVEVTGWLLFDTAHIKQAENTHPGNKKNWRATCWEIHPITSIKALDGPPTETAAFQPASLTALQNLHASHIAKSPSGKIGVERLHRTHLSKFDKTERQLMEKEAQSRGSNP